MLAILRSTNLKMFASLLPEPTMLDEETLQGLMLRDTNGVPSWYLGLVDDDKKHIVLRIKLLLQLNKYNPKAFTKMLISSMEELSPFSLLVVLEIVSIIQYSITQCKDVGTLALNLSNAIHKKYANELFNKMLSTWESSNKKHRIDISLPTTYRTTT